MENGVGGGMEWIIPLCENRLLVINIYHIFYVSDINAAKFENWNIFTIAT